jgi:hypothetical protein
MLVLHVIGSVEDCKVIDFVRELYPFAGDAMFLALTAEYALAIIPGDSSDLFFFIISECYCKRRAHICAGLTTNAVGVVHNRFSPEVSERNVLFSWEF